MKTIPREQVLLRIQAENVWWQAPHQINDSYASMRPRAYLSPFLELVNQLDVRRAVLLMGPRRVGKTVMLHHAIGSLLAAGVPPRQICYLSVDHPIYNNCNLDDLVQLFQAARGDEPIVGETFIVFDEIQYTKEWELHLKTLVDSERSIRFIASGSAAAALRLKSHESGAGRFTDFMLPPLTFYEYIDLLEKDSLVIPPPDLPLDGARRSTAAGATFFSSPDIAALNDEFVQYLNFGGYPEVVFSKTIQSDPARFIKGDIIDKVLLRDLPSLYGIENIQELNYLFTSLAFNTANEVSLEELSKNSGVAKNTIKRYIEYLEAAFLIKIVHRIDRSAKRFERANFFKVYLTNPSMRAALFAPAAPDDEVMGDLAETGIWSQWFHSSDADLHYARWNQGEVDIVYLDSRRKKPLWAVEVKWTDRFTEHPGELQSLVTFCHHNGISRVSVTSKTETCGREVGGVRLDFIPASLYCYTLGRNIVRGKGAQQRNRSSLTIDPAVAIAKDEPKE